MVIFAALMALLIQPPAARADQPATAMTLQQAVTFALDHNAAMLQAKAQFDGAAATLARNRSQNLPNLNSVLQSQLSRQTTNNAGSFAQFGLQASPNFSQNSAALQGTQNVVDLPGVLQARQAKRAYDAAKENYRLVRQQTTLDVETSYYTLVQNDRLAALAQSDLDYQRTLSQIAEANFKTGRVAGIDRLKAQVQVTSSEERLASAQADAADARENLAQLIGAAPDQEFVTEGAVQPQPLPSLDEDALVTVALAQRPEVAIAQANLESAKLSKGLVDAPNRPTVKLIGEWGNQTSPTANAQTFNSCVQAKAVGAIPISTNCGPGATHFYDVGLTSTWILPVVDWGATHAARRSAGTSIDQQVQAVETARSRVRIDVHQAVRRLLVQYKNLALAGANVDVAKQAADIAQVQYKAGLASQIDVTAAEQSYLQAAKDLLAAQVGYALALDKLKMATGTL